ncbi:ATP-binding protein [Streptomyces gibsoniae]|uniref:LuxR C-terminal-related transcriptional regulator n=1 Tax=Streptomyces gibsoniae TaxID=3075529 RepID=A0ABU2TUF1_9ACTN|nr:LuxR C-terminal-related transcriptional regulator [Streptomyces sp. DSM 41699]MDT0464472.1 LuxR C-terminal-related transcriptional regulator [Streptomyces sp. DSM 41699]
MIEGGRLLQNVRLVTLTGPAGVGKTRLALELAAQAQRGRRCDPVMVKLGQLTASAELRQRITKAVDGGAHGSRRAPESVDMDRLLVLDGCEHLLDECGAQLSRLLPARPNLRVLVTSREPVRLPGETVLSVAGLAVPEPGRGSAFTECLRSHAVLLFLDRARAVAPDFRLTQESAPLIGEICRRLEGLPMAIEMAARLIRVFPPAEVAHRLDDPLALLTSGWRLADRRHQSLRASLQWGYDLLTPAEQSLYRRLSVLPGGFGADGAVAVTGSDGAGAAETAELLISLEAKSLIVARPGPDGPARFRMLEPLRCHAHERLVAEGEDAAAYENLRAWLTTISRPLQVQALVEPETLRRLGEEHDNISHLLRRPDDGDERQLLLAGALAMTLRGGRRTDGSEEDLLREALTRASASSPYRSVALESAAIFAAERADFDTAVRHATHAVELERGFGRDPLLCRLLLLRGSLFEMLDVAASAVADLQECLKIADGLRDGALRGLCLSGLARHRLREGALGEAERAINEVLSALRTLLPPQGLRSTLVTAGMLALEKDDLPAAEAYFTEALEGRADQSGETAGALEGLAVIAARTSQFETGLRLIGAAAGIGHHAPWEGAWWRERVQAARSAALEALPAGRATAALKAGKEMRGSQASEASAGTHGADATPVPAADLPLSRRECEVVTHVVEGLTNRQVAARMHLSVRTVETHIRNIRTTLGLRSRAHIAAWAAERGINTTSLREPTGSRSPLGEGGSLLTGW